MANAADIEIDDSLYRYGNDNYFNTHRLIPWVTFKLVTFKLIYPGKCLDLFKGTV